MTAQLQDEDEATPLQRRLARMIRAQGPISVADYMSDALGHPQEGYYMARDPIGAEGDFTTAPEISQMFGELIGAFLVQSWIDMGEPSLFNLIELGPGRGVLMADILRTAQQLRPEFIAAVRVYLIEYSGRMRHEQRTRLKDAKPDIIWATKLAEAPPGPTLIVANEFFDCLPIRQFLKGEDGEWRERLVTTADDGSDALDFTLSEAPVPAHRLFPAHIVEAPEGSVFETCAPAADVIDEICARLAPYKGRALIIDYGHARSGLGDSLQAVRGHHYWPPLKAPGHADITAHVDFEALVRAAMTSGALVYGPTSQGDLLERLGLNARAEALLR
ncbi:MAG: SAM-dependent methyltransferase, partial [Pseudomonadota bacterium]